MADEPQKQPDETGAMAGMSAGTVTGASIGTVLIPVPFVGTFAGALVGGMLGSKMGRAIGNAVQKKLSTPSPARDLPLSMQKPGDGLLAQLERLGQLRDQGVLNEEEFKAAKAKLLQD